jgi:hypothetical protein
MEGEGEEAMNMAETDERQKATMRTVDIDEDYTSRREEEEYGGDTQGLAKERKEIGHPSSEDKLLPTAQSSRPKRSKKTKIGTAWRQAPGTKEEQNEDNIP